jgi:hypothetical protein
MNLDFMASGSFRSRVSGRPGLLDTVKRALRRRPAGSRVTARGLHAEFIRFREHDYAVVYRRMPNRIGLGDIFALPEEAHLFEERMRGASEEEP